MRVRGIFLLYFIFCLRALAAEGDLNPSGAKMKQTLQEVISGQLAAFRAGDFPAAYAFADSSIKQMYPLEAFETMVRTNFPVIARSASATFGLAFDNGDDAVVNVVVAAPDGTTVDYQYLLKRVGAAWTISGVTLQPKRGLQV